MRAGGSGTIAMALKYTKMERNWVMYDVGNSALVLLNTAVVPIYFNAINTGAHPAELVTAWANAQTIASLVVALLMPILGSLADYAGNKIKFFTGFFFTGFILCLVEAIPMSALPFLVVYVLCTIGLNSSMTFYDAMLTDVTTDERMDAVSSSGFAWGYVAPPFRSSPASPLSSAVRVSWGSIRSPARA